MLNDDDGHDVDNGGSGNGCHIDVVILIIIEMIHSFTYLSIHSFIHSFINSFLHFFIYSCCFFVLVFFSNSLQTSGRLMELGHHDGKLRVHYGDRLVTLMREVRQLSALGFAVPAKIQHTSSIASKFYRHGMVLKQVHR